jgi:hypothetical protein
MGGTTIPPAIQKFCQEFIPSAVLLLTMPPSEAQAIALHCCATLKAFAPRYADAMDGPKEFGDPMEDSFIQKYDNSGLLIIDNVDRRLRPPQVRALISLMHRKQDRAVILIGPPPSQHPDNEPWRALGIELYRRNYQAIGG